ncbi:hypothetical protein HANVADRAFT_53789 [Hanseniaspora valbyensis NRRL Y-1626]|uniref:BHLH domain-containing protein n=1 Tax=Hanseniaspora valbyensis NRRL Y-1626 TaxID=766949 RepID=A0A1B7TA94_9ASCO|nr:hypothetical protein HANVADRAFT_53789 [Hanseniaspora valbyensis NRRL Y-1626]
MDSIKTDNESLNFDIDLDVDFDTAYKLFEENFNESDDGNEDNDNYEGDSDQFPSKYDEKPDKLDNQTNQFFEQPKQQIPSKTGQYSEVIDNKNETNPNQLERSTTPKSNSPLISIHTPIINNYVEPLDLTPKTLALLNNDQQNIPQRRYSHENALQNNWSSPDFFRRNTMFSGQPSGSFGNTIGFPASSNERVLTAGSMLQQKTPDTNINTLGLMLSPPNVNMNFNFNNPLYRSQLPMSNGDFRSKSPQSNAENHVNQQQQQQFNLLSAKETDTIVSFLNQFEKNQQQPHSSNKLLEEAPVIESEVRKDSVDAVVENNTVETSERKLSYDELKTKVAQMEKRLSLHKNRHKISERKRRATINERFIELTDIIKYPRKESETKTKGRVTKYNLLGYVIEDIANVLENNKKMESIINDIGKQVDFQNWLLNRKNIKSENTENSQ